MNNVTSTDGSRFLLQHANGRLRIWHSPHKSMKPTCQQFRKYLYNDVGHVDLAHTNQTLFKFHSISAYCCIPIGPQFTHVIMLYFKFSLTGCSVQYINGLRCHQIARAPLGFGRDTQQEWAEHGPRFYISTIFVVFMSQVLQLEVIPSMFYVVPIVFQYYSSIN